MVKMHGPAFNESGNMVERDVPDEDVNAFLAAGYKRGPMPEASAMIDPPGSEPAKDEEPEKPNLDAMTKAELVAMATDQGMEVTGMKKAEIIELLNAR